MADGGSSKNTPDGKLSKSEKKLARKQAKSRHTLLRHEGIHTAKLPTKHLIVGNGGLGNGVSRNDLKPLFSQYGRLTDIVMLPGKPYSVVCYASVQEAVEAHEHLQGWKLRPPDGPAAAVILYLSFINEGIRISFKPSIMPMPSGNSKITKPVPHPKMSSSQRSLPPGLLLVSDFIDAEMEEALMGNMLWEEQDRSQEKAQLTLKHRRVRHFGYEFNYATNNVDKDSPLPDPIPPLYVQVIDQIMATGLVENRPDQITVNEYQPGQGIPPHVDTHSAFQDAIISLSLGSQVLMEFSNPTTGHHIPVFLPRRSLLIMTGEARYLWSHGITPRKSDIIPAHVDVTNGGAARNSMSESNKGLTLMHRGVRRSFTFRAVRGAPCRCGYPSRCDTQLGAATSDPQPANPAPPSLPTSDLQAMQLEAAHVHRVYDSIAGHFSQTRHKPWPLVLDFLGELPTGSILLDVGCGNGKYLDGNPRVFSIGCDRSVQLVQICKERQYQAFSCDGLNLPVRRSSIDACICIAVIHHFSTENRRLEAIKEIARVLRPGGLGLIYVWAKEQEKDKKKSHYISNKTRKTQTGPGDGMNKDETHTKFQHKDCWSPGQHQSRDECTENHERTDTVSSHKDSECHSVDFDKPASVDIRTHTAGSDTACEKCNLHELDRISHSTASPLKTEENRESNEDQKSDCAQQERTNIVLSIHKNRTKFESQDMLVPWHLKKKTGKKQCTPPPENGMTGEEDEPVYHRFYHVFQEGELEGLCGMVEGVGIKSSHYDQGNWGVVIRKL